MTWMTILPGLELFALVVVSRISKLVGVRSPAKLCKKLGEDSVWMQPKTNKETGKYREQIEEGVAVG